MGTYNFTDGVRTALDHARNEAERLTHEYVGTEHILLGLMMVNDPAVRAIFDRLDLEAEALRQFLENTIQVSSQRRGFGMFGERSRSPAHLPYTSRAKKVLELAMTEARLRHSAHVGCEHLFAGLVAEAKGLAAQTLADAGVNLPRARAAIAALGEHAQAAERAPVITFRLDDQSDRSIYEQLISQIEEAIATSMLNPGDRLPTVRHLADHLDIAPGTVARAYGELERRGAIQTDGTRGTRVAPKSPTTPANERAATLVGLLRPVAVATFHLGGTADELRSALEEAMRGVLVDRNAA